MKKIVALSVLTFFSFINTNAQVKGDIEFSFNAGLNFANVSTLDGNNNASSITRFNIGGSSEYYFSDSWGIKAKLIIDNKGWSNGFIEDEFGDEITTDFKLNYITIPVMANWHFGSRRNWYLNFGPYVGFLVNAKDTTLDLDVKDAFNTTDFGLAFGIGYRIDLNPMTKLFLEYETQSGFTEVFIENDTNNTIRNVRSSLNIGLLFKLK